MFYRSRRSIASSLQLACACLLTSKLSGAFVVPKNRHSVSPSRLQARKSEAVPSWRRPRPYGPRSSGDGDAQTSAARNIFFDRADPVRFDLDDDLQALRHGVAEMEGRYDEALHLGLFETAAELRAKLIESRGRDAELVYSEATCQMHEALAGGDDERARKWQDERDAARKSMSQFNLHGLWVGKYSSQGREIHEMINITYAGDALVATKVVGDRFVSRGGTSFTADLRPRAPGDPDALPPVLLPAAYADRWGARMLPRFTGRGHVDDGAREVEGQLILVGGCISFAWVPQEHQIVFGRPDGELALRMLRDCISEEDEAENARAVAERMYSGEVQYVAAGSERAARRILRLSDLRDLQRKISE